jgi:hypothetical protein
MSTEAEMIELTNKWLADAGGMSVMSPIGAALNVIVTCGKHCPPEVKESIVQFLHTAANKIGERMQ